ncbi:hypothetical protein BDC45DRAFT_503986 [Circinella umbellata]|nr:hypothetical protein BDC45DRAFT_503986 [Circinella umbellata]
MGNHTNYCYSITNNNMMESRVFCSKRQKEYVVIMRWKSSDRSKYLVSNIGQHYQSQFEDRIYKLYSFNMVMV